MSVVGYVLVDKADRSISTQEFNHVERLCINGIEIEGMIQGSIEQLSKKIKEAEIKMYMLSYVYEVNEKKYEATKKIKHFNDEIEPVTTIWYDKENPSINTTSEPCTKFEFYKKNKTVSDNNGFSYYLFGIVIGLSGIVGIIKSVVRFLLFLFKGN